MIRPSVGDSAPDVSLLDDRGRRWQLGDHRGRSVVLIFHRHIH